MKKIDKRDAWNIQNIEEIVSTQFMKKWQHVLVVIIGGSIRGLPHLNGAGLVILEVLRHIILKSNAFKWNLKFCQFLTALWFPNKPSQGFPRSKIKED